MIHENESYPPGDFAVNIKPHELLPTTPPPTMLANYSLLKRLNQLQSTPPQANPFIEKRVEKRRGSHLVPPSRNIRTSSASSATSRTKKTNMTPEAHFKSIGPFASESY